MKYLKRELDIYSRLYFLALRNKKKSYEFAATTNNVNAETFLDLNSTLMKSMGLMISTALVINLL